MKLSAGVLVAAIVLLAASVAVAQQIPRDDIENPGQFPPPGMNETTVYQWNGAAGLWEPLALGNPICEAFHAGTALTYYCNGDYVNDGTEGGIAGEVEMGPWKFYTYATVAQYLEARLTKNGLVWYILKPYVDIITEDDKDWGANSITLSVKSNGDIRLDFVGFDDLVNQDDATKTIPSYWFLGDGAMPPPADPDWMNGSWSYTVEEQELHEIVDLKMWNRLHTGKCTSACYYKDVGAIYFVLVDQKPWVADKIGLEPLPRVDP
ncbi:MAG: hypothetical protein JSV79_07965 [Armatimonadota bacterium]|nr:MAG: hypothetical protein JSV79_07965 [Armatimonadota bacterium]